MTKEEIRTSLADKTESAAHYFASKMVLYVSKMFDALAKKDFPATDYYKRESAIAGATATVLNVANGYLTGRIKKVESK